jgi:hypothetical protein
MPLGEFGGFTNINQNRFFSVNEHHCFGGRNPTRSAFGNGWPKQSQCGRRRHSNQHPIFNQKIHKKPLKSSFAAYFKTACQIRILKC